MKKRELLERIERLEADVRRLEGQSRGMEPYRVERYRIDWVPSTVPTIYPGYYVTSAGRFVASHPATSAYARLNDMDCLVSKTVAASN